MVSPAGQCEFGSVYRAKIDCSIEAAECPQYEKVNLVKFNDKLSVGVSSLEVLLLLEASAVGEPPATLANCASESSETLGAVSAWLREFVFIDKSLVGFAFWRRLPLASQILDDRARLPA